MYEIEVTVRGNVGNEPEQVVFADGGFMVKFRVGSTVRKRGRDDGDWTDGTTTWVTVNCRQRALAENVKASVRKGQPVIVQGRLKQSRWEKDGVTMERVEIDAYAVGHDLRRGTTHYTKVIRADDESGSGSGRDLRGADLGGPESAQSWGSREPEVAEPVSV